MTSKGQRNDLMVVDSDTGCAGAITWWALGGDVERERLIDTWEAAGLDEKWHPYSPRIATRLLRALRTLMARHGRRVLVRPVGASGYALVDERVVAVDAETGEETLEHTTRLVAKVHAPTVEGALPTVSVNVLEPDDDAKFPWALPTAAQIREAFAAEADWLSNHDMSVWFTRLATQFVQAVALREAGGFYYIPQHQLAMWEEVVELCAVAAPGCTIYRIPALRTDSAVQAVLDAVISETTAALARIQNDIDDGASGRALATRRRYCANIAKKLTAYEDLLGDRLDAIKVQVVETHAQIAEDTLGDETLTSLDAFAVLVA